MEPRLNSEQMRTFILRASVRRVTMEHRGEFPSIHEPTPVEGVNSLRKAVAQWLVDRSKLA